MTVETVLSNARIVLEDQILNGSVLIRDGKIADISEGTSRTGEDFEGDYLIPGLVELHTDHLEAHYSPRPGVRWLKMAAIQAHDAQVVTSGITTVFDCLRMGSDEDGGFEQGEMRDMANALAQAARKTACAPTIASTCAARSRPTTCWIISWSSRTIRRLGLLSLMDHAPGQRQFQTMEQYTLYYKNKRGLSDEAFAAFCARQQALSAKYAGPHRTEIAKACAERGITIASHDDATLAHVEESVGFGIRLAEFPTSFEAAEASHAAGLSVLMGAPNIVRGKSHSGNIAAKDLAARGVLDVLSSDYVPFSLIHAPFVLADELETVSLPQALAMVTATPARTVGLDDRGRIATGLRADIVRVQRHDGIPVVRSVWREGKRVA